MSIKFSLDKSEIRNIVLKGLQKGVAPEQLIVFEFSKLESESLNWKKDHEFELNGQMYDIVEIVVKDDQFYYTCFHDTKETKYKRRFYKLLGGLLLPSHPNQGDQNTNRSNCKTYFYQAIKPINFLFLSNSKHRCNFLYTNLYKCLITGPNAPPPKV